ncbi:MAG: hypothetical protein DRP03_02510 [Candidatus Aenigmatarchaeota archaeon]|nr:MAG: hypothetical protein DRP03_02510 [Candidatus Aenigmarchaeota archaeon]
MMLTQQDIKLLSIIKERKVVRLGELKALSNCEGLAESLMRLRDAGLITYIESIGANAYAITQKGMKFNGNLYA